MVARRNFPPIEAGFSLVELMIALLLFAIVTLGALPLMLSNIHLNQRNKLRNDGIAIASRWVDWLHAQDWRPTSMAALDVPDVHQTNDTIDPRFSYAIDCTQVIANRRFDCAVTVGWTYRGHASNYVANTIVVE